MFKISGGKFPGEADTSGVGVEGQVGGMTPRLPAAVGNGKIRLAPASSVEVVDDK